MGGTWWSPSGKVGQSEYVEQRPADQQGFQFLGALEYTGHPLSRVHYESLPMSGLNGMVDVTMGYRLDSLHSIPGSARFFSSLQLPDKQYGPLNLLSNGHWGLFPWG
jgi:hypothetical protein